MSGVYIPKESCFLSSIHPRLYGRGFLEVANSNMERGYSYQPQIAPELHIVPENVVIFPVEIEAPVHKTFEITLEEGHAAQVNASKVVSFETYEKEREDFLAYTPTQLEKLLGERFHVLLSEYRYNIKDGQLWGEHLNEPFINSIKRGRDYRRVDGGNPADFAREDAEVIGFEKIEAVLTDPDIPIGTTMLSFSPPSGSYVENFRDEHRKEIDEDGVVYIHSRRISSGLTVSETQEKIRAFTDFEVDDRDSAASFLANPIKIPPAMTPQDIQDYLHKEHAYGDKRIVDLVQRHTRPLAMRISRDFLDRPGDKRGHKIQVNAYLNKADELYERIEREGVDVWENIFVLDSDMMVENDIEEFGLKPVREVLTGCGESGGEDVNEHGIFSVSYFDRDQYGKLTFECPTCGHENRRPYNVSHIPLCQNKKCSDPESVAC